MEGTAPQVPVTQEVQPEAKEVPQAPQQPPVVPETPSPPTSPKKGLKLEILIILIALVGLSLGGFFIWKNFFAPEIKQAGKKEAEEEIFIYKGVWDPILGLEDENYLASNVQKLKSLGMNTIFISALPPFAEPEFEKIEEVFSPELLERLKEVIPTEKELLIDNIQTAHRNGMKVALTVGDPPVEENVDLEALNSRIIEVAKLAEEYDVELFTPLNEPEKFIKKNLGAWRQEILHKVKEVYYGEIAWNGAFPGFPDKESISKTAEQPPGDFAGYDYIGFGMILMSTQTLEEFSERVEGALDFMLATAERDGCKGVIITEFGVSMNGHWSEEEVARAYEIVLEKGSKHDKVFGFFAFRFNFFEVDLPGLFIKENLKTQEVVKKYFTEIL
ncbi:MAG: hypothetical protein HQ539_02085 [Parcubacteria group bacterium]|nr:hypothetical protein [Parcubacteria group bacterium]